MSKHTEQAYKDFGRDLANVKKNWKKATSGMKKKNKELERIMKETGGY